MFGVLLSPECCLSGRSSFGISDFCSRQPAMGEVPAPGMEKKVLGSVSCDDTIRDI